MDKFPFSDEGLQNLLQLFRSSSANEQEQALYAMRTDFRSWLAGHFEFTDRQLDYLYGMDEAFLVLAGNDMADALTAGYAVSLDQPPGDDGGGDDDDEGEGKIINTTKVTERSFSTSGGMALSSRLVFSIRYPAS